VLRFWHGARRRAELIRLAINLDLGASDCGRSSSCASTRSTPALHAGVEPKLCAAERESSMPGCASRLASSAGSFWSVSLSGAGSIARIRITRATPRKAEKPMANSVRSSRLFELPPQTSQGQRETGGNRGLRFNLFEGKANRRLKTPSAG
jgi:hypothetical protein